MEFYYENKLLSESLPEGYYKHLYGSLTPMKLTISPQQINEYWDKHPEEFHWERDQLPCPRRIVTDLLGIMISMSLGVRAQF